MNVMKRLLIYVKPYWKVLTVSALLMLLSTAVSLAPPQVQRIIIDQAIENKDVQRLVWLVLILIGIYALNQLTTFGEEYLRHVLGARIIMDLRIRIYAHLQRLSLSFYERTSTGELMSRATNDVNAVENFITHGTFIIVDLLRLIGASIILLVMDWRLAILVLFPVPIIFIILRSFNNRVRVIYREARDRLGDINSKLQDNLAGIRVIQAFVQEKAELDKFSVASEDYYHARVRSIRAWSSTFPFLRFLTLLGGALVLGFGAQRVIQGQLSLGTLVAFITYSTAFYDPLHRLTEIDNIIQQVVASGSRVFELLDEPLSITNIEQAIIPEHIEGDITFDSVNFSYQTEEEGAAEVLVDVSFHMPPGEVVALVGPSGAGKTSIARLLLRFYDPTDGCIKVDDLDLRQIDLDTLRENVAVVLQDTFLFNGTVRENLCYGKPDASEQEIFAAAETAYAHEFIQSLPEGYDTEIGERGVKLSGGQKQRLSLARAILTDPRILILDEATSSVDAEAEYLIQKALESVMKGRTSLVIAHRLSTIRNADKIIAVEQGRICEVGTHEELLSQDGLYASLYRRQLALHVGEEAKT